MRIGVSLSHSKSLFGPLLYAGRLDEGLRIVHRLGYDGVELSLRIPDQVERDSLRKKLQRSNLCLFAIATGQTYYADGYSLYSTEAESRELAIQRLKGHIDLAADFDCMVIIGGIRGKIDTSDELVVERILASGKEAITTCAEHAERRGVTLLLEPVNRYETNIINTAAEGIQIIKDIGSSRLKLLLDTFHMNIEERSIVESIVSALPWLSYVHFADSNRLAPGLGHLDFEGLLLTLVERGYQGPLGVEVLPKPGDYEAAEQAIRHVRTIDKRVSTRVSGSTNSMEKAEK
jgi:sugar phosphate isomerase/epimerase